VLEIITFITIIVIPGIALNFLAGLCIYWLKNDKDDFETKAKFIGIIYTALVFNILIWNGIKLWAN
jgi:hypothetical protein